MKSKLAKSKIKKIRIDNLANKDELIYRYRLACDHDCGFKDGYCIDCESCELYVKPKLGLWLAGERFDRGLISSKEYNSVLDKEIIQYPTIGK